MLQMLLTGILYVAGALQSREQELAHRFKKSIPRVAAIVIGHHE